MAIKNSFPEQEGPSDDPLLGDSVSFFIEEGSERVIHWEESVDATSPFFELSHDHVLNLLEQVHEPENKQQFIDDIKAFVKRIKQNSSLKRYFLQIRGSLFSNLIEHVSDADIQLFSGQSSVTPEQCESLLRIAQREFYFSFIKKICVIGMDDKKVEISFENISSVQGVRCKSFILSGYSAFSNGFILPVDVALTSGGETRESRSDRKQNIISKLKCGDFAKVLQKIRALYKKGSIRDKLVTAINSDIGKLRFLVKQLLMIQFLFTNFPSHSEEISKYLSHTLGMPSDTISSRNLEQVIFACELELQSRALFIIKMNISHIAPKLQQADRSDEEIRSYLRLDKNKYGRIGNKIG